MEKAVYLKKRYELNDSDLNDSTVIAWDTEGAHNRPLEERDIFEKSIG